MSRTSGVHPEMDGVFDGPFASKPAPTFNCGSGIARDEAISPTAKPQSNMKRASLLNCASNRLAGIGRPNR
jgi:hypothetical protein